MNIKYHAHSALNNLIFLAILLAGSCPVQAQRIYISPDGNDTTGRGSESSPWKTLYHAAAKAVEGDTLLLAEGNFTEARPVKIPSGVSIRGAGTDKTVIKSAYFHSVTSMDVAADYYILQVNGTENASFSEFTLDGDARRTHGGLLLHDGRNVSIHDVVIKDINFCGVWITNCQNTNVYNAVIENCAWPSTKSCSGAMMIAELADCSFHDIKIRDDRAYGIKNWAFNWRTNQPYREPGFYQTPLRNVHFYNLDIVVEPVGAWANGQSSNFTIEFWNAELYDCTLHDSYFNETVSIPSEAKSGQKKTMEVYNNQFIMSDKKGVPSYSIEAACTNLHVHHNYFKGGYYPMASFGPIVEGQRIHHNVFEDIWGGGIVHHRGVKDMEIYNNTVFSKGDFEFVSVGNRNAKNVVIRNNLFYAWNKPVASALLKFPKDTVPENIAVADNWFYNWKPEGRNAKTGNPLLELSGYKPGDFFKPAAKSPLRKNNIGAFM